jgi:hypothetical protein
MKISVLTPTADRPVAFALVEKYMARQTMQPDEWIVADGGEGPTKCTMGQRHLHEARPPGAANFAENLLRGAASVTGDIIIFFEDDDWYAPNHIETIIGQLNGAALLAGDDQQRYYHVGQRCWRIFQNKGASLCQTAMRRSVLPRFEAVVRECLAAGKFHIDYTLWMRTPDSERSLARTDTVLGIKGLPGRAGLGIGHRPSGPLWNRDPALTQLRAWIGQDVGLYESLR